MVDHITSTILSKETTSPPMAKHVPNKQPSAATGGQIQAERDGSDNRQQSVMLQLEQACFDVCKFLYGFSFGYVMWLIIIRPYLGYFDFTFGSTWPSLLFSLLVGLVYVTWQVARCIMVLFIPSLVGNASQNYIIVLLFVSLISYPMTHIGQNAVESIRVVGCSLTMTFESLRERAKLMLNPMRELLSPSESKNRSANELEPIKRDLINIQSLVGQLNRAARLGDVVPLVQSTEGKKVNKIIVDNKNSQPPIKTGRQPNDTEGSVIQRLINKTDLELDPSVFGLRASIELDSDLVKLVRSQQKALQPGSPFNVSETLYSSCLAIFREAKESCRSTVQDMRASCKASLGPYFSTLWCSPVIFSLNSACPWLMRQLVDERSLCSQLRDPSSASITWRGLPTDVNQLFTNLTGQLNELTGHLIGDSQIESNNDGPKRRLELSITFNEQTKRLFVKTRALVEFITDKYKMRRLFLDSILLLYEIYTSYTFLSIVHQAHLYRARYLENIRFDNCYVTGEFIRLDKSADVRPLLPLTSQESKKYLTTFTCRRRTQEERAYQRASCWSILMFLAFTLAIIFLDNIFYSLLVSIHDHSLVRYKQVGFHELDVQVHGTGSLARFVRRLSSRFNSVYQLSQSSSSQVCLPVPSETTGKFYLYFASLSLVYFVIDQISIYAMRLRRITCAFFYPAKEHQRIVYLRSLIQHTRQLAVEAYEDDDRDDSLDEQESNGYSIKDALAYLASCSRASLVWCK